MKRGSETTYILLTRGDEDKRLYEEITRIIRKAGSEDWPGKVFYKTFPMLGELLHLLRKEIEDEEEKGS